MREWSYEIVQDIRDGSGLWFIEGSEWEYSYDESGSAFRALSEISDFAGPFDSRDEAEAFATVVAGIEVAS